MEKKHKWPINVLKMFNLVIKEIPFKTTTKCYFPSAGNNI